ncbi:integrase core domain-containing protein [Calycomorphotria hydatis]|uniref:integrase core domain-containing protein n=1 Tax=Calycomorphotria hydatis TaxID=2528027 RepID=UPI0011A9C66C
MSGTNNTFIESFNGSVRAEYSINWFLSLANAKEKLESWSLDNNQHRPHSNRVPGEYASFGQASLAG